MIIEIDHILVAAHDPDAAAADLADALGLTPAGGGAHAAIGTRNALLSLAGPYLEVIGLADEEPETRERASRHPIGAAVLAALDAMKVMEGAGRVDGLPSDGRAQRLAYVSMALRTDDAVGTARDLAARGSSPGTVGEVVRRRPDGSVVRWPVVLPERLGPSLPPFLIEHAPDEPERAARLAGGGVRLEAVEIPVDDPGPVAAAWARALGLDTVPVAGAVAVGESSAPEAAELAIGPHRVVLRAAPAVPGRAVLRLVGGPGQVRVAARGWVEIRVD